MGRHAQQDLESALYFGEVTHRRRAPIRHAFRYRVATLWLDLDELPEAFDGRWLWSARRPALAWFRRADFLTDPDDPTTPLKDAVLDRVEAACGRRPRGPVRMLAQLRTLGLSFNPVVFYFCYDEDGRRPVAVVAEITNTPWNERHAYVLVDRPGAPLLGRSHRFPKTFHVSPFFEMDHEYDWTISAPGERLAIHMKNRRAGDVVFDVTLALERRPLDGRSLAVALARHPWMSAKVVLAIYWQALLLRVKGAPFFPHPSPPKPAMEQTT